MMVNRKDLSVPLVMVFFLVFSIFPLTSLAQWLPSGPECSPEDDFNPTHTQTCEYKDTGANKPREVRLKWQVATKGTGTQFCALGCTQSGGTSCAGAVFKDNNGFGAGTPGAKLFPKDDIKINDKSLAVGNTYQTFCCALKDPSQQSGDFLNRLIDICQDNTLSFSQKMKITNSTACEVPFSSIANNLKNNVIPTIITETSFKDWGNDQALDNVKATAGLGSGDKEDLKNEMDSTQQCTGALGKPNPVDIGITGLREMQISTYAKQPVTMSIFSETTDFLPISAHAVIVLKVTEGANKNFTIRVLDSGTQAQPDYPKAYDMECSPGTIRVNEVYAPTVVCVHPEMGRVWFINDEISVVRGLKQAFLSYCRNNSFSKFCTERKDLTGWLEANYPKIQNFVGPNGGVCSGWSVFILRVAYLGDFVGTDYRSNDGKIVGKDCDANHYPIGTKKTSSANSWLANIWSSWQGLIGPKN